MNSTVKRAVAIVMSGAIIVSLSSCSVTQKVKDYFNEPTTTTQPFTNKTVKPTDELSIIEYFNKISNTLKSSKPFKVKMNRDYSAGDFECENSALKAALPTIRKFVLDNNNFLVTSLEGIPKDVYPVEGSDRASALALSNVKLATCSQKGDNIIVTLHLSSEDSPNTKTGLGTAFNLPDKEAILKELKKSSEYITVKDYSVRYVDCKIVCTVDRQTDNILSSTYTRTVNVTADVEGVGTLENVGKQKITFNLNETENYEILWEDPDATTVSES